MNESISSDSDIDELEWSSKKKVKLGSITEEPSKRFKCTNSLTLTEKFQKFEELKKKSEDIRNTSHQTLLKAEKKRARKLVKKAWKDPYIRHELEKNVNSLNSCQDEVCEKEKVEWNAVKPFLAVNSHLQGPVSHGSWGPKNEVESKIEDCIREGNFQQAEILSDTLANKQFAQNICKAFSAKRYQEKLDEEKTLDKEQRVKKIRWTFEAKEKWQMKGNM